MPKVVVAVIAALALLTAVAPAHASDEMNVVSYARLGEAVVFDGGGRPAPAFGFGIRGEMETFAVDVSGLNLAIDFHPVDTARDLLAGSLIKIEVLRFLSPYTRRSAYVGGGMSWGQLSLGREDALDGSVRSWTGSGLQAELTAGYEFARKSPVRFFVQADASAPFFMGRHQTFEYSPSGTAVSTTRESRYIPTVVVSAGVGWHRQR